MEQLAEPAADQYDDAHALQSVPRWTPVAAAVPAGQATQLLEVLLLHDAFPAQ